MFKYSANTQLKFLFYIALIAVGIYYVDSKYDLFDIKLENLSKQEELVEEGKNESEEEKVILMKNSKGTDVQVTVEYAVTEEEKSSGLMYRTTLGDYEGMLFIYEEDATHSYWMRNVLIPLDMIFIDKDGVVVSIQHNTDPCAAENCPSYPSGKPFRYVLEVNGGWSQRNYIEIGGEVTLPETTLDS